MNPPRDASHRAPALPPLHAVLRVLVLQQGRELECSETASIRRLGDALFHVESHGIRVSGPYTDFPALFARHGRVLLEAPGGRLLEWEGRVISEDRDGRVAGPYASLDEWVWSEAETVSRTTQPLTGGGGFVHAWQGLYFVTVDPLPAWDTSFSSLETALREMGTMEVRSLKLQEG